MRNIPAGNGALSIAHAGHELRLHGFIEKAKPYIFILSQGQPEGVRDSRMPYSERYILDVINKRHSFERLTFKGKTDNNIYIKDAQIYSELILGTTDFFRAYISMMVIAMKEQKIDYIVTDASEGKNIIHEMCSIMTNIAVKYILQTTGKKIEQFQYSVINSFKHGANEDSIQVKLDKEATDQKLSYYLTYHPSILEELKPDITIDMAVVGELRKTREGLIELKDIIYKINPNFFENEYIIQYSPIAPTEILWYEAEGKKLVAEGMCSEVITYEKHIQPMEKKLETLLLGVPA